MGLFRVVAALFAIALVVEEKREMELFREGLAGIFEQVIEAGTVHVRVVGFFVRTGLARRSDLKATNWLRKRVLSRSRGLERGLDATEAETAFAQGQFLSDAHLCREDLIG